MTSIFCTHFTFVATLMMTNAMPILQYMKGLDELDKLLTHTCASVKKQYNLVPANGR